MRGRVLKVLGEAELDSPQLEESVHSSSFIGRSEPSVVESEAKSPDEAIVKMYEGSSSDSHILSSAFSQNFDLSALMKEFPAAGVLEPRFQKLIDRHLENLFSASSKLNDHVNFASARQKVMVTNKLIGMIEQLGKDKVASLDDRTLAKALSLPKYTTQQYEIRLSKLLLKQAKRMRPCDDSLLTIFDDKAFAYDLRSKQTTSYRSNVFELSSGITLLNSGTIVITGGFNHPKKCWCFDIKRQKIKNFAGMNEGRGSHCSLLLNNLLYVFGGRNERGELLDSSEIWNGENWMQGPKTKSKREGASAIELRHRIYVIGGSENELLSTGEVFEGDQWHMLDYELPEPLSAVGLVAISRTRILIIGGFCRDGLSKNIYELRVTSGKCRLVGTLQRGDIFKSNGYLQKNQILLLGSLGVHSIKEDYTSKFRPYKQ